MQIISNVNWWTGMEVKDKKILMQVAVYFASEWFVARIAASCDESREEWEGKVSPRSLCTSPPCAVHPRPAAYHWWLPTSIIPTLSLTSSLWPGPASGADICRHVPPLCWLGIKQSFSHTLWGHWHYSCSNVYLEYALKTYRSTLTFLLCPFNRLMCH